MRTSTLVGLLWLLARGGQAKYDPNLPLSSEFDYLYRELSILARVTNAIALQASMIRGTFKPYTIMAESMRADPDRFPEIRSHDTSRMNSSLDQIIDSLLKIQKTTEKNYGELEEAGGMTRKLMEAERMDYEIDKTELVAFFKKMSDPKTVQLMMTCKKSTVETVANFWNVMSGEKQILSTQDQQKSAITSMKSNIAEISKCTDIFPQFYHYMHPVIKRGNELRRIVIARDMLKFLKGNGSKSFGYSKTLDTMESMFLKTVKMWNPPDAKVYKMIQKVNQLLKDLKNPRKIPEPFQTVGFGSYGYIPEDVRFPWFVDKVAMGESVEKLVKALEKFSKFGVYMDQLQMDFRDFGEEYVRFSDLLGEYSKVLEVLEVFDDVKEGAKFLKEASGIFEKCWSSKTSSDAEFKEFDKNIRGLTLFNSTISEMLDWVNFTISKIDLEVVRSSFGEFSKLDLDGKNLEEMKELVQGIGGFKIFAEFASRFSTLHNLQGKFEAEFTALTNLDVVKIVMETVGSIRNSSMSVDLECLRDENFNISRLEKIMKFLESARTTADDSTSVEDAKEAVEYFTTMRASFLRMEAFLVKNPMSQPYDDAGNLVLTFNVSIGRINYKLGFQNSAKAALAFGSGIRALYEVWKVDQKRDLLLESESYSKEVRNHIAQFNRDPMTQNFWKADPNGEVRKLVKQVDELRVYSGVLRNQSLVEMKSIFDFAQNLTGFKGHTFTYGFVAEQLGEYASTDGDFEMALENADGLTDLHLDLTRMNGEYQAAKLGLMEIRSFFDELFGLKKEEKDETTIENSYLLVICISIPTFFLLISCAFCIYGLTENGHKQYKNLYLYYFGKPKEFEKRWRYSLFMDRQDGQNALIDAVREINEANVREIVRGGAYINVYNQYGNTCLHMATKRGYAEIVDILLRNGADRTLINVQNRTPVEMLNLSYRSTQTDSKRVASYSKIEQIYKKYEKKKFRVRVPEKFPWSSFHIFADKMTEDDLTNRFMNAFPAVATTELLPTTTHYIVKTDPDGILDVYSFDLAYWILSGVIVVRDNWMTDCLKNPKTIERDSEYLVEKARYNGMVYDTVVQWSQAMAKGTIPYLYGVFVALVIQDYPNVLEFAALITMHGGTMLEQFPDKSQYNNGSHPYLHSHLGPLFIIHDGKANLDSYRNDTDKMYTLFTEEEFVHFMLKRMINVDRSANPTPVLMDGGD